MTKLVIVFALVALFTITAAKPQGVNVVNNPTPDSVHVVDGAPGQVNVVDGDGQVNFVDGTQGPQPRDRANK